MKSVHELLNFINNSPVSFFAIDNVKRELLLNGFQEISEASAFSLKRGDKCFVERNGSSIIAFTIGKEIDDNLRFNIVASHSDSPCFKLKPVFEFKGATYNKVMVEPYGGLICSSWFDRPLSIAGRMFVKENDKISMKLLNIDKDILMIPNVCIHFNRNINSGYTYDYARDMIPFLNQSEEKNLTNVICEELNITKEDIINFDLYLYNRQKGIIWGADDEFVSSPRLDDLECVYTSVKALIASTNDKTINVVYVADNEEVGSSSMQGAAGDFLLRTLNKIKRALNINDDVFDIALTKSLLVSADNAHSVHPNHPELTDPINQVFMNKGLVIKFNASQSYTSDGLSSSILQTMLDSENIPYQFFANASNIRGGSTLGNIAIRQLSIKAVDVGLAQLAMHSSYETAGARDIEIAIRAFTKVFNSKLETIDNLNYIIK